MATNNLTFPRMAENNVFIRAANDNQVSEWIPAGTYYIDTRKQTETADGIVSIQIVAYDAMMMFEQDYPDTTHAWPYKDTLVVAEMAAAVGIQVDSRCATYLNKEYMIDLPVSYTMRETLEHIAAAYCGNFIITAENKLLFVPIYGLGGTAIDIGETPQRLNIGNELSAYSGVVIHAGQDSDGNEVEYSAGDSTGYVLDIDNPIGTQAMADNILADLQAHNAFYQPFEADRSVIDPTAEIGDSVIVNGTESVIVSLNTNHSHLMASDVSAPYDEEVDHEFTFVPKEQREFKRESAYARARITVNENAITLESRTARRNEGELSSRITVNAVDITLETNRATAAEGDLSSRITVNANAISAEVTRAEGAESTLSGRIDVNATAISARVTKTGGSASSFGWTLTDSSWSLSSNNQEVFKVDSTGATIKGSVTATSGTIGGCSITNGVLQIASANISSINADIITAGTLNVDRIANASISGAKIGSGTITGGSGGNISGSTLAMYNMDSYTYGGIGGGYGFTSAQSSSTPVSSFFASTLGVFGSLNVYSGASLNMYGSMTWQNQSVSMKSLTFTDGAGTTHSIYYLGY